jgi:hypothetical protein
MLFTRRIFDVSGNNGQSVNSDAALHILLIHGQLLERHLMLHDALRVHPKGFLL